MSAAAVQERGRALVDAAAARAEHEQRVEAVAAVDVDGRVERVLDEIRVVTAVHGRVPLLSRIQVDGHEAAHDELIVAALTLQRERADVAVDAEHVVLGAAEDGRMERHAVAQVRDPVERQRIRMAVRVLVVRLIRDRRVDRIDRRLRDLVMHQIERRRVEDDRIGNRIADHADDDRGRVDLVTGRHAGIRVTRRAEHLTDLERVLTRAAVDRRLGAVVVGDDLVVAGQPVDGQHLVDVLIVVDPLHGAAGHGVQ